MENSDYLDEALRRSALNSLRTRAVEALENTGEGSVARGVLSNVGLKTTSVSSIEVSNSRVEDPYRRFLVAPERSSVGEFEPEINWPPRVEYSTQFTAEQTVIEIESSFLAFRGSTHAKVPVEELSEFSPGVLPEECFTQLANKIAEIDETVASQREEARLQRIRARKERAVERKSGREERAKDLLRDARSVLLAWALVALVDGSSVSSNKVLGTNRDFVSEAQKLWKKISRRHPTYLKQRPYELDMTEIGDAANVPIPVTKAQKYAVEAVCEQLASIDEEILPYRAEAVACEVVEDRIVEGDLEGSEPESRETEFDPKKSANELFSGKSRSEGANTHLDGAVKEWIHDAYWHFRSTSGLGSERAKDKVVGTAESHNYHFSRKSVERYADLEG
jgi:hypothetical protein